MTLELACRTPPKLGPCARDAGFDSTTRGNVPAIETSHWR